MSQLERLTEPVKPKYVSQVNAGGGRQADYVAHSVINELLLMIVGPFDFEITQPVRGTSGEIEGCLARLTVEVDGRRTSIVEAGDITGQEKNDGERLKNASSDALKRSAMRLGLGLHLWAGDGYFLHRALAAKSEGGGSSDPTSAGGADPQPGGQSLPDTALCSECGRDETIHAPSCSRRPL